MRTTANSEVKLLMRPKPLTVQKEDLGSLLFPNEDVLVNNFEKYQRDMNLEHSILLGNLYHFKVCISFEDIEGPKKVYTTIWGVTDKVIILKGNITIPIHRITSIIY